MTSVQAVAPQDASLRRALLRLLVVVSVLMLVAGIPMLASSGHRAARAEQELRQTALTLRSALALYRSQHDGRQPDAADWTGVLRQLSQATDVAGQPGGNLGPYVSPAWVADGVSGPGSGQVADQLPGGPDGSSRWIWCRRTGELRCNLAGRAASGVPFWEL